MNDLASDIPSSGSTGSRSEHECQPIAPIPAWWSGFLFHVLNPRQVCMYVYLSMLTDEQSACHPTIEQIREDLGLYSASMVFEALTVLEDLGFIVRERQSFPGVRAKRNVYRLTACEYTILRLLETNRIDGSLRPRGTSPEPGAAESKALVEEGLREILGDDAARYESATSEARRDVLLEVLGNAVKTRPNGIVK